MLSEEDIVLPAEQMAEAVALSLAKGERDGLLLLTGVLWSDYVLDRQKAKSFCAKILSTGHVVKALVDCLDVTHEASQADNEVLQKASDAAQTLMYLNNRVTAKRDSLISVLVQIHQRLSGIRGFLQYLVVHGL